MPGRDDAPSSAPPSGVPRRSRTPATVPSRAPHLNPTLVLLVAAGGAVGTAIRAIAENAAPAQPGAWPWTTFVINVTGSFVLAALVTGLGRRGPDEGRRRAVRLAVGTGVLGGYTTYSSFAVEADRLLGGGHLGTGLAYALVSVALGVGAAVLGVRTARALVPVRFDRAHAFDALAARVDPTLPRDPDAADDPADADDAGERP
ncbi:MAG TPA: hypothetical protein DHV14_10890 [Micrococcales bacterium]|uniref:fluoride efflux transporter FluC n=1 Tax=Miniimonas arenae TaxID=676201 RepID=UPI000ECC6E1E|nr:CrcB family protein [Miniimonas arenae]HCX85617.1 hypothetical protein [Micrococcales bacterium]